MKTTKISVFAGVLGTTKAFDLTLEEVAERLKTSYKAEIEHIRTLPKAEYDEAKKKLHAVLFGGVAVNRNDNDIQEASGLMITDYDHLPDEDYQVIWDWLKNDKHTVMLFRSPSGDGIKAVVSIPKSSKDDYRKRFKAYGEYVNNPYFDTKNSNISRLCFVSYDPDLYVNWDAVPFEEYDSDDGYRYSERPAQIPITDDGVNCERLLKWLDKKFPYSKGNRNDSIYKFAISCCDYGVNQDYCFDFTKAYIINDDFSDAELLQVVRSAYSRGNFQSKYFEDDRRRKLVVSALKSKQPTDEIKAKYNITDEVLAEIMGNTTNDIFWAIDNKGKISIDSLKFKRFLEDSGFFKYFPEGALIPTFVKVKSNILSFSSAALIKEYILDYLEEKEPNVFNYCSKNSSMFTDQFLTLLKSIDVKILQDTKDTAFIPFLNGVLKISKNNTQLISYIDINGFIWERQIIQRNWKQTEAIDNDFADLCHRVCDGDALRMNALSTALGYLIHSYKDKTHQKAIIFNDQEIDDNPNGGSGKSIMINALKAFKNVVVIDGKKYDNKGDFVYQRVSIDSQVLAFDDVRRNFNFEDLFPLITEGVTVNRKNKDEIFIPFERSPKILITTNYIIKGTGHSHERRRHEIEFFQYFNAKRTPIQQYGRLLFDDWNEADWNRFDNFMVFNLQNYLESGLVAAPLENASRKRYIQETCSEFVEFMEDYQFDTFGAIYYKALLEVFQQTHKEYSKLTNKKWGSWIGLFIKNDAREWHVDRDRGGYYLKLLNAQP
jgi:hypothetical protein